MYDACVCVEERHEGLKRKEGKAICLLLKHVLSFFKT
jgi:hypothetical protein